MHYDEHIKSLRPTISTIDFEKESQPVELFQNEVVRPIIKLQSASLLHLIKNEKNLLTQLRANPSSQHFEILKHYLQKNKPVQNQLIGVVYGLMTHEEQKFYFQHQKEFNKRISSIITERAFDHTVKVLLSK